MSSLNCHEEFLRQCCQPLRLDKIVGLANQFSDGRCTFQVDASVSKPMTNCNEEILRVDASPESRIHIPLSRLSPVPVAHRLAGEEVILGKGTYGVVKLMMDNETQNRYAVKCLDRRIVKSTGMESQVCLEIIAQSLVNHPNVVKCWNVVGDQNYIYLILEYCQNGDLFRRLRTSPCRRLTEREVFGYFLQLISGLAHIHNLGICHRDLKLENLLLDEMNNLKIADFGWATRINGMSKNYNFCGTLDYLSPEMIRGQGHDWRIDIWGVGVLLYELLMGKPPFLSTKHHDLLDRILNAKIHDEKEGPGLGIRTRQRWIKADALQAVCQFLQPDPTLRICFRDVLKLDWVQRMIAESYAEFLHNYTPFSHVRHTLRNYKRDGGVPQARERRLDSPHMLQSRRVDSDGALEAEVPPKSSQGVRLADLQFRPVKAEATSYHVRLGSGVMNGSCSKSSASKAQSSEMLTESAVGKQAIRRHLRSRSILASSVHAHLATASGSAEQHAADECAPDASGGGRAAFF